MAICFVFCFGFLLVYKPLGIPQSKILSYWAAMAIYCFNSAISIFLITNSIKRIKYFSDLENWTVLKYRNWFKTKKRETKILPESVSLCYLRRQLCCVLFKLWWQNSKRSDSKFDQQRRRAIITHFIHCSNSQSLYHKRQKGWFKKRKCFRLSAEALWHRPRNSRFATKHQCFWRKVRQTQIIISSQKLHFATKTTPTFDINFLLITKACFVSQLFLELKLFHSICIENECMLKRIKMGINTKLLLLKLHFSIFTTVLDLKTIIISTQSKSSLFSKSCVEPKQINQLSSYITNSTISNN